MIVLEVEDSDYIEVSLFPDTFNLELKKESVKQFNIWYENLKSCLMKNDK